MENIKFSSFPIPNLKMNSIISNYHSGEKNLRIKKLVIYPELLNIYNYGNFKARKVILENSDLKINLKNIKNIKNIYNSEKKTIFKNLNLEIKDGNNNIINFKKISFSNYGYKKNIIDGELFDKKFKIDLNDDLSSFEFKLLKTGLSAILDIQDKNKEGSLNGSLKGKVLKSNFYFKFVYDGDVVNVDEFFFRDKKLSFDSKGYIELKPFFYANITSEIKNIDSELIKTINIDNFLKLKRFIKNANTQNNFVFKTQRFSNSFFDSLDIKTNLAYGRLNISKTLLVLKNNINCESNVNLMEEYPVINFRCSINILDKKIY